MANVNNFDKYLNGFKILGQSYELANIICLAEDHITCAQFTEDKMIIYDDKPPRLAQHLYRQEFKRTSRRVAQQMR